MNKKIIKLLSGILAVGAFCTALTGCGTQGSNTETASIAQIANLYDNTSELLDKFPVADPTPVNTDMEKNIQNRLLNGFENWNRGYDAWKAWGDILYTKDSVYNVHGVRLTLGEYQDAMNMTLKQTDLKMGSFENMVICDDWTAIRYNITNVDRKTGAEKPGTVIEFVNFKDYGKDLGTRVVEGWAGIKGADYEAMSSFQTDEEKAMQKEKADKILATIVPDTQNLEEKYPVLHPITPKSEIGEKIKQAILTDFDKWNEGYESWSEWADTYYDSKLIYKESTQLKSLSDIKAELKEQSEKTEVKRLYFDNMLISGDWAAIFYRVTEKNLETGEITDSSRMEFLKFEESGDSVKVLECRSV